VTHGVEREMTRFLLNLLLLVAALSITSTGGATVGEVLKKIQPLQPAQRKAALEEGAKKEGQVVIYTSVSLSDYPKILAAFEQAHPFIKTHAFRSTPSGVFRRVDTEAKAGRFAVDLVGSAPIEVWQLKERQLSTPYASPERGSLFKGSFDADSSWTAFDITPIVLAYNTKLVSAQEAPKNYQELLSPKWRGKMSLGTEDYDWFSVMLDHMGKDKGLEYMKSLAKQNLHMPGSSSVMRVQLLLGGESSIAIAARGRRVAELKSKGAPIDFRIFDPYAGEPDLLALLQRAPNPHAAILFYDWLISQDGQTKMSDLTGRISVRNGIKHQPWLQELLQKDFVFVTPSSRAVNLKEVTELYHQVFGLHQAR
jgi:iron(III) transport system substrate-binding protein